MSLNEIELPGYARPVGADEGDFPYRSAAVVNNWAHLAGNMAVPVLLDQIRRCLGNPGRVMDTAGQWSPEASSLIQDANEGILSAKTELNAYWSGRAAESFNTYIDHISDTIDSTQGIMRNMAALMGDLRTTVDETYCKGLEFIKTCATGVLDAAGSAAQNWYTLWGAVCGAILEALSAFAAATIELLQEAIRTMGEYALTGRALGEEASQLHTPDPLPPNATQPGNWQVNPA